MNIDHKSYCWYRNFILEENTPDYIKKREWPPHSCDLNPLDYAVWDKMEKIVYKNIKSYDNLDVLKTDIQAAWDSLSMSFNRNCIDQWRDRLNKVVQVKGGHIEQYC